MIAQRGNVLGLHNYSLQVELDKDSTGWRSANMGLVEDRPTMGVLRQYMVMESWIWLPWRDFSFGARFFTFANKIPCYDLLMLDCWLDVIKCYWLLLFITLHVGFNVVFTVTTLVVITRFLEMKHFWVLERLIWSKDEIFGDRSHWPSAFLTVPVVF
jgi:hypothetical protein